MEKYWTVLSIQDKIKFILSIIAGILVVIFATLNWKDAKIDFIFNIIQVKLSVAIMISVVAGYLVSFLFSYRKQLKNNEEIESLTKKIEKLERKIEKQSDEFNPEAE
jgi:uncharacterized integral membrane protein